MSAFYQFLLALLSSGFFVAANVITSHWSKTEQTLLLIPVVIFSFVGYILFGLLIKQSNLAISSGLVDALIVIFSILIGIFILNDTVTNRQLIGLILACLAVILLL
jgi:drug/metabolite transporter (DMT)-like permease